MGLRDVLAVLTLQLDPKRAMLESFHSRDGIVTVYRKSFLYDAPSQVCVTISNCPDWDSATSVLWQRIPDLAVVAFFVDKDCQGEIAYTSDPSLASGSHAFNLGPFGKSIRSLMVLENSPLPTAGLVFECFPALNGLLEDTNATNSSSGSNSSEGEATVTFLPAFDANTTSNWLDPLPSEN